MNLRRHFLFVHLSLSTALVISACVAPPASSRAEDANGPMPPWRGLAVPADPAPVAEPVVEELQPASEGAVNGAGSALAQAAAGLHSTQRPLQPAAGLPDSLLTGPVMLAIDPSVEALFGSPVREALATAEPVSDGFSTQPLTLVSEIDQASTLVSLGGPASPGVPIADTYFAVVTPFDTVQDDIAFADLLARWQGDGAVYTTEAGWNLLPTLLGDAGEATQTVAQEDLISLLEENREAIGILPFDQLDPRFKAMTVDGVNVLSNSLEAGAYPLVTQVKVSGAGAAAVADRLQGALPETTNRDPAKLTALVMTGVTAMARGTAAAIERSGDYAYPALIVGPELAQADITHVSNEIPFIEGCVVENYENNLILCSDPAYWAALEHMGTDIVGLSGNHVNDFGRDGARESLAWYAENEIPVYGSGLTIEEACAPLLWEDHGNTFAFIAALAYGPESAWVTDDEPGACYYYEHKESILDAVRSLSEEVDVVAVELQYEETYFPSPTEMQVVEFRELREAGADLVTGVQSHVPQAQEPYGRFDEGGPGMISYGLGNLFFDQMWSWETRTELFARHTIYDGEIIGTEILTGVLEDFAQPRWTTPEERAELLQALFDWAPSRP